MNNNTSIPGVPHYQVPRSRREFLARSGAGFGAVAMAAMLEQRRAAYGAEAIGKLAAPVSDPINPLAAKRPHYRATAKNVIFVFLEGGPSHLDTFDPKPLLNTMAGKPAPDSMVANLITAMGESRSPILASKRRWRQCGQSGLWMSDWIPHHQEIADEIAVLRSCVSDGVNHSGGVCDMNTGSVLAGRPSLGAWVTYGLGTENQNMPAFCVLTDSNTQVINGPRNWGAGFMPAVYQGTKLSGDSPSPISNLMTPASVGEARQHAKLELLKGLNEEHAAAHPDPALPKGDRGSGGRRRRAAPG